MQMLYINVFLTWKVILFCTSIPTDMNKLFILQLKNNDHMFQSQAQGHWNCSTKFNVSAKRVIPPGSRSIYAGAEVPSQG